LLFCRLSAQSPHLSLSVDAICGINHHDGKGSSYLPNSVSSAASGDIEVNFIGKIAGKMGKMSKLGGVSRSDSLPLPYLKLLFLLYRVLDGWKDGKDVEDVERL
jgi:hypothetical protein